MLTIIFKNLVIFINYINGITDDINDRVGETDKKITINFTYSKPKFCSEFTLYWQ